jgi:transcriptional regulator with XRE-family HTH domain
MVNLTIGERLKDERVKASLTTSQVCEQLMTRYNYSLSIGKLNEMESDKDKDYGYRVFVYLSKLYNVSTDYLLGLTDVKTNDTTLQSVCEYTGLSEEAIKTITDDYNRGIGSKKSIDALGNVICNKHFRRLIWEIIKLKEHSAELIEAGLPICEELDIETVLSQYNELDKECKVSRSELLDYFMELLNDFDYRKIKKEQYAVLSFKYSQANFILRRLQLEDETDLQTDTTNPAKNGNSKRD